MNFLGIGSLSLIGAVLLTVLVVLWLRGTRRRIGEAAGTRCPECGGDLREYPDPFTCPHCYAVLGEEEDEDEPEEDEVEDEDDRVAW